MKIGIDYRPAIAAPWSGIGRQVRAMEQVLAGSARDQLLRYSGTDRPPGETAGSLASIRCPARKQPVDGMHRPHERLRFEAGFLPSALAHDGVELYIATANRGLPLQLGRPKLRKVLLLHDLFQWTHADAHASRLKAVAYRLIERGSLSWSLRTADVIWAPSQFTMQETARLFPALRSRLRWLPNCVPPLPVQAAGTRHPILKGLPERYWLTVGTRGPRKNLPRLLSAWLALRQDGVPVPDLALVGDRADLPATFQQQPGLHVFSGIDDSALGALYQAAERLWHPAYAEGFGLPVVEALAAGTAVAVALGTALDEVTPPEAPRFDPQDPAAIARQMRQLAHFPGDGPAQPWRDFAANYAPASYAGHLLKLIDELRT
ncbi:glycosyltransferase family 4 protein [Frateuria aurantia]